MNFALLFFFLGVLCALDNSFIKHATSKSVQIILLLLKEHNINQIVLNPGTGNIPLILGTQSDSFFTCYSVVDERSAMYFAIGLYLDTGRPVALSCTSAQATRNYIPGLTEAFYKHIPILAITCSYPWGKEYMQAPVQTSLPVDAVKRTFALPCVKGKRDELQCVTMVNEAILEIFHRVPGPVQLNVPCTGEFHIQEVSRLPTVRVIKRYMVWDDWSDVKLSGKRIMLVIGEHRPFSKMQIDVIHSFMECHNAFVYVNHLSNYHGKYIVAANLALSCRKIIEKPDILITIGGQPGDYALFGILASGRQTDFEHWRVIEDGGVIDTYDKLTKIFECPSELFFSRYSGYEKVNHSFYESWKKIQCSVSIPDNLPFSNAYLAQQLHGLIPKNSYLNLAILNSLRVWSYFPLDTSVVCYSNVAAFGIDGCMSVLVGQSVSTNELCFLVIGDLAFFYDMNSLGIRHIKNNIRILLVNNGCGAEFKLFDHVANKFGTHADAYIAAVGHNGNAKGWAEGMKFKYFSAFNKDEFLQHRDEFVSNSEQSILLEVFTSPESESEAVKLIKEIGQVPNSGKKRRKH